MTYEIVTGWTSPVQIGLLAQGETPTGTMSGMTAELILQDRAGIQLPTSGDVTITDATNWIVTYVPDAADLVVGIYLGRVKVTDGSGAIAYFPSGLADTWIVRPVTS